MIQGSADHSKSWAGDGISNGELARGSSISVDYRGFLLGLQVKYGLIYWLSEGREVRELAGC